MHWRGVALQQRKGHRGDPSRFLSIDSEASHEHGYSDTRIVGWNTLGENAADDHCRHAEAKVQGGGDGIDLKSSVVDASLDVVASMPSHTIIQRSAYHRDHAHQDPTAGSILSGHS